MRGDGPSLKAYTIGVSALGVNTDRSCPETTARMQASRVRRLLKKYYQLEGKDEAVEVNLPSGVYEPRFLPRRSQVVAPQGLPRVQIGPFESLSGERLDDQLCRGLADSLVGLLVACDHIKVTRQDDVEHDDAAYTLAGTLTRVGNAIRLSFHLRQSSERETIWSDRLDRELSADSFLTVQDEVALNLACRIGDPSVGAIARFSRSRSPTGGSLSAVDQFYQFLAMPTVAHLETARSHLERTLTGTSSTASVHAAYSCALSLSYFLAPATKKAELIAAESHARTAIGQDSACALAHFAKALAHYHHREAACAFREINRCIELSELSTTLHAACGLVMVLLGQQNLGIRLLDRCRSRAPHLPGYFGIAYVLYYLHEVGDPKHALAYAEQLDLQTPFWSDVLAAACLSRLGRSVEARSAASRVATAEPHFSRRLDKRLSELLLSRELVETLSSALSDAGLGSPSSTRPRKSDFKVSIPRRGLPSEIRVGILQSLSGTMALSESHLVNAALLAIDEINQAGGILGRPVRALVEDGASDPEVFASKAQKLVQVDGVGSIFGCWTSSSRKAVLPVVEQKNALLWYPLQYEGLEKSKHIIYTGSCLNQQIEPAVRWALRQHKANCYLIGSDYVFPRTANRLIRALVESGGGQVLGECYQPLGTGNFEQVARDIARLRPEIVYNTVNGAENTALFRALGQASVHPRETPVMSFSFSELELAECSPLAQGQLACWSYFQSMDTPKNRDLVQRFRRRYGQATVLSDPAVTAYSQLHLFKMAAERAQSLETERLLSHLGGCGLELGDETFEVLDNNHVNRRAVIGEVEGSQFRVIWSSPQTIAPQPWLGVDQTDFLSRDLILGALQALPEMAERSSLLARQVRLQALGATPRNG